MKKLILLLFLSTSFMSCDNREWKLNTYYNTEYIYLVTFNDSSQEKIKDISSRTREMRLDEGCIRYQTIAFGQQNKVCGVRRIQLISQRRIR